MKLFHAAAALLIAALAACASLPRQAEPEAYYVMRHLQKAEGADPGLSEEGRRNAERLAAWLAEDPPRAIYVSTTRRARETAMPLAARLGLAAIEYDPRDTSALVERVKQEKGSVLIVGHSNTVPDIVEQLGGTRPADLTEQDYGDVWMVRKDGRTEKKSLGEG